MLNWYLPLKLESKSVSNRFSRSVSFSEALSVHEIVDVYTLGETILKPRANPWYQRSQSRIVIQANRTEIPQPSATATGVRRKWKKKRKINFLHFKQAYSILNLIRPVNVQGRSVFFWITRKGTCSICESIWICLNVVTRWDGQGSVCFSSAGEWSSLDSYACFSVIYESCTSGEKKSS